MIVTSAWILKPASLLNGFNGAEGCQPATAEPMRRKLETSFNSPESVLAERIRAGRTDLLGELATRYSDRIYVILLKMTGSRSASDDILQNTWVQVIRKFHQYDASRPLAPWLIKIAVNCCRTYFRRERLRSILKLSAHPEHADSAGLDKQAAAASNAENELEISRAMKSLSPKLRETVALKFYSGLTHEEIAQALSIPPGTVKSRLHTAMSKLRLYFEDSRQGS